MHEDAFFDHHPALNMAFFLAVMLITAFVLHPVITGISLVSAAVYTVVLRGRKAVLFMLAAALPLILLVAVLNPLFNHEGVTVLFYLWNGNAVTLEAVLYGLVSACMFAALLLWFYCMNAVMTSDKLICLFGGVIPTLSLVFSMVLRFVPRLFSRIKEVSAAQKSVVPECRRGPVSGIRHGIRVLSATVSWALESSVVMSDSMRSRGYGSAGRTSYSLYRFTRRDVAAFIILFVCFGVSVAAMASKAISFRFYPSIKYSGAGPLAWLGFAAFSALCLLPVLIDVKENIRWHVLSSKI